MNEKRCYILSSFSYILTFLRILLIISAYLGWGLLLGLQAPFYPKEAELKGATSSQYGSVFGTASLAAFIFSTIFGKFSLQIGPKLVYNIGAFTQAIIGIIFGFLKYVQDVTTFLGLSYLLR